MDTREMLERYAESLKPDQRAKCLYYVRAFAERGDLSKGALLAYLDELRAMGYRSGTVRWVYGLLHAFYVKSGVPWPLPSRDTPVVRESDVHAPALSEATVAQLIALAQQGRFSDEARGCLALSTTYGLRRVEMAGLRPEHLRLDQGLIYVHTAKHGRERWHLVPGSLVPHLRDLARYLPLGSPSKLTKLWWRIEEEAGLGALRRQAAASGDRWEVGWHAIRRMLDRLLLQSGLSHQAVQIFLRWKRSSQDMPSRYFSSTVVGLDRTVQRLSIADEDVDREVFERHPFLKHWQG